MTTCQNCKGSWYSEDMLESEPAAKSEALDTHPLIMSLRSQGYILLELGGPVSFGEENGCLQVVPGSHTSDFEHKPGSGLHAQGEWVTPGWVVHDGFRILPGFKGDFASESKPHQTRQETVRSLNQT